MLHHLIIRELADEGDHIVNELIDSSDPLDFAFDYIKTRYNAAPTEDGWLSKGGMQIELDSVIATNPDKYIADVTITKNRRPKLCCIE